jgi:hypothetical protein
MTMVALCMYGTQQQQQQQQQQHIAHSVH